MNSAEGYYYDYEGTFLGGPYKSSSKVKVCKHVSKEAGIDKAKGKKITYDSFHDPLDLEIEYDDFIKIASIVMGESTNKNGYNLTGSNKISDSRIKRKHYVSKEDSFLEKKNIAMCCVSNSHVYFKGVIADGLKGSFSSTIGKPRYNLLMDEDIEKRNDKEELRASIKATILGILEYNESVNKGLVIATNWDGVDVIEKWNNPHPKNSAGIIDIENNFTGYINYLLTINHPDTGLKDCYAEVERIKKKYDLEIEAVRKERKSTENVKQDHIEALERRKNLFANFDEIKNKEVARKIKEMRESTKGKQLSIKEDCINETTKAKALKKGYLTIGHAGATIFYLEYRHEKFNDVIANQLK